MYYHGHPVTVDALGSMHQSSGPVVGRPLPRREDHRLLSGSAEFLDDVDVAALEVAFLRSPLAHGRIVSIACSVAAPAPGVVAVVSAADALPGPLVPPLENPDAVPTPRTLLADAVVRFVGEPVA